MRIMDCIQFKNTISAKVGSKIIRAVEIIRVKNSYLMQFYEVNICEGMMFMFYTVYNKHVITKNDTQTRENSQVLSQVLV